jgi:hypothetical protein
MRGLAVQRWALMIKVVCDSHRSSERPKTSSEVLELDRRNEISHHAGFGKNKAVAGLW